MPEFDALALINTVADLANLVGRRTSLEEFLDGLVANVAQHLSADVCSVYLYDVEEDLLVLRATYGLNRALVGGVRLGPGEGLTGMAFLENRTILEEDVLHSELNKAVPDLGEEEYPCFLAVPIKRSDLGIGVLTLQQSRAETISTDAIRSLRAIASHLAITLENAAALYELADHRDAAHAATRRNDLTSGLIHGRSASRGLAIGRVVPFLERNSASASEGDGDLRGAIERSISQLQELQRRVDDTHSDVAAMIFSSHLLMLQDDSFIGEILRAAESGTPPVAAVEQVVEEFCTRFSRIPDPRFQEKAQDVRDIGHRIVLNLGSLEDQKGDYRGAVVILEDLFPSELVKLYLQNVEGIVFGGGAATGHVAILAQSLGVPLVASADPAIFTIPPQTRLVVDAEDGKIVVEPSDEVLAAYRTRIQSIARRRSAAHEHRIPDVTATADAVPVTLLANVNLVKDAREAASLGAAGVGLYRSEFPFLIRNGFPTEEEQYVVYRRVLEAMDGRSVALRTLDLGGDKLLSSQVGTEENPFLGFRGIRFLLEHRDLFRDQLRAMLRAGAGHDLGIQFPMVSGTEELTAARDEVELAIEELAQEGLPHNNTPRLGAMIELPSAVELAPEIARLTDFLSVGTNDLVMYLLAADRGNHRVASIYRSFHPSVLRVLARLVSSLPGTELSVCGNAAADPAMAVFLLGIGVRRLSVDPGELVPLARTIASIRIDEAREIATAMLATATVDRLADLASEVRARFRGIHEETEG